MFTNKYIKFYLKNNIDTQVKSNYSLDVFTKIFISSLHNETFPILTSQLE